MAKFNYDTNKLFFTGTITQMDDEVASGVSAKGTPWKRLGFRVKSAYAPNRYKTHFCTAWGDDAVAIAAENGEMSEIGIFGTPETQRGNNGKYYDKVTVVAVCEADVCPTTLS